MTLLLAILQTRTFVVLQHPMLAAVVARAEPTVPYYPLCCIFAVFEAAADLLGRHTATESTGDVERCFSGYVVVCEGGGGREVFACVDEAEI